MPVSESILHLPGYEIIKIEGHHPVIIHARYLGPVRCPQCQSSSVRTKDRFVRCVHHESFGRRPCYLHLEARKYQCLDCGRYFHQRFPGLLPYRRSTENFRQEVFEQHRDGVCQTRLAQRVGVGTATVERWVHDLLQRKVREWASAVCPRVLGIDEHFFSRRDGYATTLCNLEKHRVYDVVLGRSEAALGAYFEALPEREKVEVVCMDLASVYRVLVQKYMPQARIVADRFHVIRLVNHHFLAAWRGVDPVGSRNRALLSLMRRHQKNLSPIQQQRLEEYLKHHPVLEIIYLFKQKLCRLLLIKHRTARQCRTLIRILLAYIRELKATSIKPLKTLGETLGSWQEEIACMWRFTKNNAITEGFHTKMEMISRRAYGFKNFENYRLRVKALCA